jgi:1-deoxy-D-xylulose-5-phosphate synthase
MLIMTAQTPPQVGPILERVNAPSDLDGLSPEELVTYCDEMRTFLLDSVKQTGGHLGSNLGVIELTVALHKVFEFNGTASCSM